MRILFAGIIARYPFGGVTWCSLMYLLGLRALGHEVFYIEDTGECVYDPVRNTIATDPVYGTTYINSALEPFGLGDRWAFVNFDGSYHGATADAVREYAAGADVAAVRARDQRAADAAARARLDDRGGDARLAHAGSLPRFHSSFEGRVRRRQAHLHREPDGLVQRPHRVLSGVRPSRARTG